MAEAEPDLTSGGIAVTRGSLRLPWRDPRTLTAMAFVAFGLVYMIVNATTLIDQRQALGQPIEPWRAWLLELTSFLAWLLLLPAILWLARKLLRIRHSWLVIAGHAAGCVALSLCHTLIMVGLRYATFAFVDEEYAPAGAFPAFLLFEFRKDLITYASIVLVFLVARRLMAGSASDATDGLLPPDLIEVRDGSRTFWLRPEEVDWVSAAGNYVELHGAFGVRLARRTLSDMERELARHGFARVHRSRLVRQGAVASIETRQSGDFDIVLRSGETISGSRRFRANLHQM